MHVTTKVYSQNILLKHHSSMRQSKNTTCSNRSRGLVLGVLTYSIVKSKNILEKQVKKLMMITQQ